MEILVINSGSSSLKYKLFESENEEALAWGLVERIGVPGGVPAAMKYKTREGRGFKRQLEEVHDHRYALELVLAAMVDSTHGVLHSLEEIGGVGHRVLHGGEIYADAVLIDDDVIQKIESLIPLGPLHMPANIMGIKACSGLMPGVPQVAVFDTSFHQTLPRAAYLYAIPHRFYTEFGIRKYGFHGTSHRYVSQRAAELLGGTPKRLITLHLGNGCSASAIENGRCIETTMGYTPLEGLVMGTRSGDIDPAAVTFLGKTLRMDWDGMSDLLNRESGLMGLSGISADMRDIQKAQAEGDQRADDAYRVFVHRLIKHIGGFIAVLRGLDALVFTGGIGENDAQVREDVCDALPFTGLVFDREANRSLKGGEAELSASGSRVRVLTIPTNEELMISRDTLKLLKG